MGFLSKLFSSSGNKANADLSKIVVDMHSHLIPGIDDGVKTLADSVSLIRKMSDLGYKKLITTPHIMSDYYKNTKEIIYGGLETVRAEIKKEGIPIELEAAAEYMYDDGFIKKIESGNLLTFANNNILIELGYYFPPERFFDIIFDLKTSGFNPILAHPERYMYWHDSLDVYQTLHDRDILMQINLPSLSGYYAPQIKKVAEMLIDRGFVDFVGTDLHNEVYFQQILKSQHSNALEKLIESGVLKNSTLL